MKRVYDFLSRLREQNNREWFNAHKEEYIEVQGVFNDFTEKLIDEIGKWDEQVKASNLSLKDCTYRIYRDTRFSKDKTPYKTHMGAYICRGGKKSPYAGYYFHVEPATLRDTDASGLKKEFLGGSLLAAGLYCPESKIIQSLRDEISVNGESFFQAIAEAKGFTLDTYDVLKKVPRGFEQVDEKWKELLKHRDFSLSIPLNQDVLFSEKLLQHVSRQFKTCYTFNHILNMAVEYALEEM